MFVFTYPVARTAAADVVNSMHMERVAESSVTAVHLATEGQLDSSAAVHVASECKATRTVPS